ncbi:MCP methyltransferase, CheR-type [Desulfopila aestuarii DSM 18488]|uniref:protein-glutamate O-methyltransferase n=2 Tax=Desulfopila aestuarii TaxID=231440 RepID=A0A1M7XX46_9BACT|nr:MCP methyltransferase, CheR-type [Desulfopila aestuarii DSM 18488]
MFMDATLTKRDFQQLSSFIYDNLGIKMPDSKSTMLTGRLTKRLRALELSSFSEYCDFLFSPEGQEEEMVHLVNVITTNKTDFFREPSHFSYLTQTALPTLQKIHTYNGHNSLKVWSAGCSTGEEPYTLAMVLSEVEASQAGFRFDILATDISTRVLEIARRAIYPMGLIQPVAPLFRKKYLLKGKNAKNPQVRIVPELRKRVRFGRLNFMDENFGLPYTVDIIFCRNVIIYFDKQTQEKLMIKFCQFLNQGGYLFLGHSESLHGYDTPLSQVAPTIYRKL